MYMYIVILYSKHSLNIRLPHLSPPRNNHGFTVRPQQSVFFIIIIIIIFFFFAQKLKNYTEHTESAVGGDLVEFYG
jgi:hypothetical protein